MVPLIAVILKNLPLIISVFAGLGRALERVTPKGAEIDTEHLSELIEGLVEAEVVRMVEKHKKQIVVNYPDEEDRQRQMRLDELEAILIADRDR